MNLKKILLFLLICILCINIYQFVLIGRANSNEINSLNKIGVSFFIKVLDVNDKNKTAKVEILVNIPRYPYNKSNVGVHVIGSGSAYILCNNTGKVTETEWYYNGKSKEVIWFLQGHGETFPFDTYELPFILRDVEGIDPNNFTLCINDRKFFASFGGKKQYTLLDLWHHDLNRIPVDTIVEENKIIVNIHRKFNVRLIDFILFLIPIIGCYYLLGLTLILDPQNQIRERLTIYLSLFVFSITFSLNIQPFLPYRTLFSFPEFLLSNLIISITIFGISTLIGNKKNYNTLLYKLDQVFGRKNVWIKLKELYGFYNKYDFMASILSLILFMFIYYVTIFKRMNIISAILLSYIIIPSYMYSHFFMITSEQRARNIKFYIFLSILFVLPLIIHLIYYFNLA